MTLRTSLLRFFQQEDINFLLTNRLPRRWATLLMGRISRCESPLLCRTAIPLWQWLGGLDLSDSGQTQFRSLRDCFVRPLAPGARPLDSSSDVCVSPCDGIVGAFGKVTHGVALQIKGMPYRISELLGDSKLALEYEGGWFVTLRITSAMYHRFHAPCDGLIERVTYQSGDTWNVNPIALKRVERLFCRNERAAIRLRTQDGAMLTLVPVAAILVASIRLHFLDVLLHLRYRGSNRMDCHVQVERGQELGWFEHGSTIVVLAPRGLSPAPSLKGGETIRMGQPLLIRQRLPEGSA
jgi:phosphatidylserine decarboxylase